jgi:AraC-like DNA-binding protein
VNATARAEIEGTETRSVRFRHIDLDLALPITADPASLLDDHPIRYLHQHQCAEIGLCVEGSGVFVVGEKVMEFSAGDVTFINSTEVHLARSMPGTVSRWHWIYLDPLRLASVSPFEHALLDPGPLGGPAFHNVIHSPEAPHLGVIAARIVGELGARELGFTTTLTALAAEFMVLLRRARPTVSASSILAKSPQFDRIAPAIALIARNFAEPLSVEQLARACSMSEPTLRRAFTAVMGCSPRDYWLDVRLQMSATMLRSTTMSVVEVSRAVGFTTLSSFNRLFIGKFGNAPRTWRKISVGS